MSIFRYNVNINDTIFFTEVFCQMPKKILIFVPDLFRGGIARAVEMLIGYLSTLDGIETHVVVMDDSPLSFPIPKGVRLW